MNCPRCAEEMEPSDRFCEVCGAPGAGQGTDVGGRQEDLDAVAAVTDRGRVRPSNEDAFCIVVAGHYAAAVVCDGVATSARSAEAAGAAAEAAIGAIRDGLAEPERWKDLASRAVGAAQDALSAKSPAGDAVYAGATTIVVALAGPGRLVVANVGDSRAYWIGQDGEGRLLTTDDTWVREAIDSGIPEDEARSSEHAHEITAWLGEDAWMVEPHVVEHLPPASGRAVVCTDGLWNYADTGDAVASLIIDANERPTGIARQLTEYALRCGGADNVTVAVLDVPGGDPEKEKSGR